MGPHVTSADPPGRCLGALPVRVVNHDYGLVADFKSGIQEGLQSSAGEGTPDAQGGIAKVVDVKVAGEDAVLLTYTLKSQGTSVVVQTLALPVGNVFVISLVTLGDVNKVDSGAAETYANDLTVAAIEHLGTVAEGAQ